MNENAELLTRIEGFCRLHEIAETTFGFRAVNDGKLVGRLRAGKTINVRTFRQVEAFLSSITPAKAGQAA